MLHARSAADIMSWQCHAGDDKQRAGLAAVGTWHQELLLFSLPHLQPLQSEDLGEVGTSPPLLLTACHASVHQSVQHMLLGRLMSA